MVGDTTEDHHNGAYAFLSVIFPHFRNAPTLKLYEMTPEEVISHLNKVIDPDKIGSPLQWEPTNKIPPNTLWLKQVYLYLTEKMTGGFTPNENIKDIFIVPDQFQHLWEMGKYQTPLLLLTDTYDKAFKEALNSFGIPVVSGDPELIKAIQVFVQAFPQKFIWYLTSHDLVDILDAFSDDWTEKLTDYNPQIHDPIIDFLSEPRSLKTLEERPDQVEKLKNLLIFPTEDEQIVTIDKEGGGLNPLTQH